MTLKKAILSGILAGLLTVTASAIGTAKAPTPCCGPIPTCPPDKPDCSDNTR